MKAGAWSDKPEARIGRLRDILAAAFLFLATAGFVLWQNRRVAVLWDLGYLLDTSWRIALGQLPYRDFPLVHPPLTFLIQAAVMRLGGRHYFLVIAYSAIAGGLGTVLTWGIVRGILRGAACPRHVGRTSLFLAAPLIPLGIYSIYPHPIYDCDCALAILFALLLALQAGSRDNSPRRRRAYAFLAGMTAVVPSFFKQNMGLPFLAAAAGGALVLLFLEGWRTRSLRRSAASAPGLLLAGIAVALLLAALALSLTVGLGNYLHWTIRFAAQRRLPGLPRMLSVYRDPSLLWTLPTLAGGLLLCHTRHVARPLVRILAACLTGSPFAAIVIRLFFQPEAVDRADNLLSLWPLWLLVAFFSAVAGLRRGIPLAGLLPFFVLAAIHGTFLSQQLWGSTYAIWPLLIILMAQVLANLPAEARSVAVVSAVVIAVTLLIGGTLYARSMERLSYIDLPEGPVAQSTVPALRGLAARGPYLGNLEELLDFAAREIPTGDGIIPLPGEDPFFYATGRVPQFPVTLFDPTTDPYSAAGLFAEARRRNIRWIVVKRQLQIDGSPLPEAELTMHLLGREFEIYRQLDGYDVYRRR